MMVQLKAFMEKAPYTKLDILSMDGILKIPARKKYIYGIKTVISQIKI